MIFCFFYDALIFNYSTCDESVAMRLDELNEAFEVRCL